MAWEDLLRPFLWEAGCGKSELAVHLARRGGDRTEVHFFDLDQTKPLMRSRDAEGLLEKAGVTVHFQQQYADAPTQVGGLIPLLLDEKKAVILDVGGNDTGAEIDRWVRPFAENRRRVVRGEPLPPMVGYHRAYRRHAVRHSPGFPIENAPVSAESQSGRPFTFGRISASA